LPPLRLLLPYTTLFRSPSCIPSRRALLTGKHPSNNGVTGFINNIPIQGQTLPRSLRDAGYQTVLIGRTMHQSPSTARYGYDQYRSEEHTSELQSRENLV